jgi:PD-(D/E)XK nuclease superfamily
MEERRMSGERWRDLPPVDDPLEAPDEKIVGQTFLRHFDRCDRAAYLYRKHEGGPASAELNRGAIFHTFAARAIRHLIDQGERQLPPEVAKDMIAEVLVEHAHLTVPAHERRALRYMAYHFAEGTYFDPTAIVGVEQSLSLQLGDWLLRGRVDLLEQVGPARLDVTDWKTSFDTGSQEEHANDFQTHNYAMLVAFGVTPEGLRLGDGIDFFGLKKGFPRFLYDDGIAMREHVVNRIELSEFREDLEVTLKRLEANFVSQKWQPTPGSHCAECPSELECPLPRHLRPDSQLNAATREEAESLASWHYLITRQAAQAKKVIKAFADRNGYDGIRQGRDLALVFNPVTKRSVDHDGLPVAVEGAVEYGTEFDLSEYVKTSSYVGFDKRKTPPGALNYEQAEAQPDEADDDDFVEAMVREI